jgi:hypothetical protein
MLRRSLDARKGKDAREQNTSVKSAEPTSEVWGGIGFRVAATRLANEGTESAQAKLDRSVFLVTLALRIGADIECNVFRVGPLLPRGEDTPEGGEPCLIFGIALEILAEDEHRLAAQVFAARAVRS